MTTLEKQSQAMRDAVNGYREEKGYSITTLGKVVGIQPSRMTVILNGRENTPKAREYLTDLIQFYKIEFEGLSKIDAPMTRSKYKEPPD